LINGFFPIDFFEPMMRAIIRIFNTDPQVVDVCRVMRLPGFFHMKKPKDPFLITLQDFNPELRYTFEQLKEAFPVTEDDINKKPNNPINKMNVARTPTSKSMEVNERAQLNNIINGGCPALKRTWDKPNIPHRERVALMSLAIRTNDGEQILRDKWPSEITNYQIDNARKNNLLPWSCRQLQAEGICQKTDPLFGDKCFKSKDGHEPSPIRLAFGVKRAFKNIQKEIERE
jgi:hypothetical protein